MLVGRVREEILRAVLLHRKKKESNKMNNSIISLTALVVGGAIGYFFGIIQNAALARNAAKRDDGKLRTGWAVMPGSMGRVAVLLVVLAAVQICCPLLFTGSVQWLVSAGVLLGYGGSFVEKLRHRAGDRV